MSPSGEGRGRDHLGLIAATLGAGIGGAGVYLLIALFHPMDVSTTQYLTLDEKGELGLEGLAIIFALCLCTATAVVGTWLSLWLFRHRFAFTTALLVLPAVLVGSFGVEGLQHDLVQVPGGPNVAWMLFALPVTSGIVARGVIVALFRKRAERPPGRRFRFSQPR